MEALMTFAIGLTRKCFTADSTNERAFIRMSPEVRPEIVRSSEALGTEVALERGWMLFLVTTITSLPLKVGLKVGKVQDIIAMIGGIA
jgi:hypothetical protein